MGLMTSSRQADAPLHLRRLAGEAGLRDSAAERGVHALVQTQLPPRYQVGAHAVGDALAVTRSFPGWPTPAVSEAVATQSAPATCKYDVVDRADRGHHEDLEKGVERKDEHPW
jgi:hypothetical protein